jgi:Na+-driven multidrug efflux pump
MTVVYVPLAIALSFSFEILTSVGQNETVASYAAEYIQPMIPAMYFLGLFDLARRFLTCLQYSQAPMVAQLSASAIHIILCVFCVSRWEIGVRGLGFITLVTYFLMFIFTAIYALSIKTLREAL